MKKALIFAALYTLPLVAFAQTPTNFTSLVAWAGDLLNRIIPLLIAAALVFFFFGLIKYIRNPKDKQILYTGLIALFLMVSVWGIIRLAQNTFGVNNSAVPSIPQVPQRT